MKAAIVAMSLKQMMLRNSWLTISTKTRTIQSRSLRLVQMMAQ